MNLEEQKQPETTIYESIEFDEKPEMKKEQIQAQPGAKFVIRRRKGEADKRIFLS